MHIRRLKPDFAVSDMPGPDDFDALQAVGFRTLINFRPDGEAPGQGPSKALQALARRVELGLFNHITQVFRHLHPKMAHLEDPQVAAWGEANKPKVTRELERLDAHLNESRYIAGDAYSIADITALVAVDFFFFATKPPARLVDREDPAANSRKSTPMDQPSQMM